MPLSGALYNHIYETITSSVLFLKILLYPSLYANFPQTHMHIFNTISSTLFTLRINPSQFCKWINNKQKLKPALCSLYAFIKGQFSCLRSKKGWARIKQALIRNNLTRNNRQSFRKINARYYRPKFYVEFKRLSSGVEKKKKTFLHILSHYFWQPAPAFNSPWWLCRMIFHLFLRDKRNISPGWLHWMNICSTLKQ